MNLISTKKKLCLYVFKSFDMVIVGYYIIYLLKKRIVKWHGPMSDGNVERHLVEKEREGDNESWIMVYSMLYLHFQTKDYPSNPTNHLVFECPLPNSLWSMPFRVLQTLAYPHNMLYYFRILLYIIWLCFNFPFIWCRSLLDPTIIN